MTAPALRLGTRGSTLARSQSATVAAAISASTGRPVELVSVSTAGDRSAAAIAELGGTGVFVTAVRDAVLAGEVDLAVHSYKDLPTAPAPGLRLAAVPPRADARDALVARDALTLAELRVGALVGTGSPRRTAQLRALGLGLEIVPLRGNVDTRLSAVSQGRLDAVVLARAGLQRLGRLDAVTETLDPLSMLPAPAQGALAVECRDGEDVDDDLVRALAALDHADSRSAVAAERALLATLEAGCTAPVGAYAEVAEGDAGPEIFLRALVTAADGSADIRLSATGSPAAPREVGRRLAAEMLDRGAAALLASGGGDATPEVAARSDRATRSASVPSATTAASTSAGRAHD